MIPTFQVFTDRYVGKSSIKQDDIKALCRNIVLWEWWRNNSSWAYQERFHRKEKTIHIWARFWIVIRILEKKKGWKMHFRLRKQLEQSIKTWIYLANVEKWSPSSEIRIQYAWKYLWEQDVKRNRQVMLPEPYTGRHWKVCEKEGTSFTRALGRHYI